MNFSELRAEMGRCNLSIPKLADIIKVSKKTLYSRFSGETDFSQPEIVSIAKALNLSDEAILRIFFAEKVS